MTDILQDYINSLKKLKRGFNPGFGKAPHKPILLLAIITLIEQREIYNNRISISSELVTTYKDLFLKLVNTGHHDNFALPFYHMGNEPFYRLVPKLGMAAKLRAQKSIKSLTVLTGHVAYAEIDGAFYNLLEQETTRTLIKQFLYQEYFQTTYNYSEASINLVAEKLENDILNESPELYKTKLKFLETTLKKEDFEEELFMRGGAFKKTIPKIYNYKCCVSGLRIVTENSVQMVDACHIIPFSISQDDTIQNGLSLSPNIHRAFDRGLLTVNENYIVRLSPTIDKRNSSNEILALAGKQIELPTNQEYFPSLEALQWHNKEVFLL